MASKQWYIRDVDEDTKKKIKRYAIDLGVSVAKALRAILSEWEAKK